MPRIYMQHGKYFYMAATAAKVCSKKYTLVPAQEKHSLIFPFSWENHRFDHLDVTVLSNISFERLT